MICQPSGPRKTTETHGHSTKTRTYNAWSGLLQRTLNPKHPRYKDYGGRGITVDKRWFSFEAFLEDMGECPRQHSIDRVDNDKGYSKENCRWTTYQENSYNKRTYKNNTSGEKGVSFCSTKKRWLAYVNIEKKRIYLGAHKTKEEAIKARRGFNGSV